MSVLTLVAIVYDVNLGRTSAVPLPLVLLHLRSNSSTASPPAPLSCLALHDLRTAHSVRGPDLCQALSPRRN